MSNIRIIRELKKEIVPIICFYLFTDIWVVGTFFTVWSRTPEGSSPLIYSIMNFMEYFWGKYFSDTFPAIFSDFGGFIQASFYYLILFIVLYVLYKYKNRKQYEYEGEENGSGDWAKYGEEYQKNDDGSEILNKKEGFILSRYHYLRTDLKKVKINKNILVIGGSGARKICLLC